MSNTLPPMYSMCGCGRKTLVIWGGTVIKSPTGGLITVCPDCKSKLKGDA